jgi:hypothetical protein
LVFLREHDARIFKLTHPGIFGEIYYLREGRTYQRNCSPLEYFIRLHLWEKLFRSAPVPLGIAISGGIVSAQPYIKGHKPSQAEVDKFLLDSGLVAVKRGHWLWKKTYEDFEIWVGDARDDNFVNTDRGIVPIDIRLWFGDLEIELPE